MVLNRTEQCRQLDINIFRSTVYMLLSYHWSCGKVCMKYC